MTLLVETGIASLKLQWPPLLQFSSHLQESMSSCGTHRSQPTPDFRVPHEAKREDFHEDDHGYHSSENPLEKSEVAVSEHLGNKLKGDSRTIDNSSDSEVNQSFDEDQDDSSDNPDSKDDKSSNPFLDRGVHRCALCCTNGYFAVLPNPFSEFECNCGCTTRNLVDLSTRVTWTNLKVRHQYKIHEVTYGSPFRDPAATRLALGRWKPPSVTDGSSNSATSHTETPSSENQPIAEGDRGFPCRYPRCGRRFCRNEELTRHIRIHSGQRPFLCQTCGRRFVRRDHLAKHERTHLPVHAKRTYSCPLPACPHRYTRSDALTRHMWTTHHIRARQPSRPRQAPPPHHAHSPSYAHISNTVLEAADGH